LKIKLRALVATCLLYAILLGAPTSAKADPTLYAALGERAGLTALTDDFVARVKSDPRTRAFFKDTNAKNLAEQLRDQFCVVAGGPCVYEGATMAKSHADLGIGKADYLAVVEMLQDALDAQRVPFAVQNDLLARLAPMHREIVTR
jgi:hemoglobin